ncbi:pirin family protein [Aeromicrobium sp. CF3.5]|uniref:pirin family protein n=1 Tax=Aeromicrobium sp. CF3.5 TaxID=3373078 RepID=UPI003EE6CE12
MPEQGDDRVIVRFADRYLTDGDDLTTRHSFSYGAHYDPANVGFGPILAINTERLAPGAGYGTHRHSDVEIVTWVVEGALRHADSAGGGGVIRPGTAQRLSAGTGVEHTEVNESTESPLEFVQMMLASTHDAAPEYEQVEVADEAGRLLETVTVRAGARLYVTRLEPGDVVTVPSAPRSLVHVTRGVVRLDDTVLLAGDEARLGSVGPYDLSAVSGSASVGGEALVWQLET